jgi:hypothetical protein
VWIYFFVRIIQVFSFKVVLDLFWFLLCLICDICRRKLELNSVSLRAVTAGKPSLERVFIKESQAYGSFVGLATTPSPPPQIRNNRYESNCHTARKKDWEIGKESKERGRGDRSQKRTWVSFNYILFLSQAARPHVHVQHHGIFIQVFCPQVFLNRNTK